MKRMKDCYTVSLPISCTYPVKGIYAVDEQDAQDCAVKVFKKHRPDVGFVRKVTPDENFASVELEKSAVKENASHISEKAEDSGTGSIYDVVLLIYGYYVVPKVNAKSKSDAGKITVEQFETGQFVPDTGALENPQVGLGDDL